MWDLRARMSNWVLESHFRLFKCGFREESIVFFLVQWFKDTTKGVWCMLLSVTNQKGFEYY